jgi:alkyl sulfatase BDS1-like metallo-beta-lactamase superfamily hydrolase
LHQGNIDTMTTADGPDRRKPAHSTTKAVNAAMANALDFDDRQDFEDARRGFVGTIPEGTIANARGTVVWNLNSYQFLEAEDAPDTVNPSLWRQARLNLNNGLFEVCERVYQVRGLDLANMTIIEGDEGLLVIDPLTTTDTARAALELYFQHRPTRPISAVIYSHSHVDHYGGVKGVIDAGDAAAGKVEVWAPDGFMEAVGGENVLAGNPMARRAQFQFGGLLKPGPKGQVDAGLGKGVARGRVSLVAPNRLVLEEVERHTIDGVDISFQLAPDSEAPAEMHMYFHQFKLLNMAENATHNLHNFCPLRGSVVRDPRLWSGYLAQAIELFGADMEILIGQHHWPTWGRDRIVDFLGKQRDLYKFIHDQSVRLMNHGLRPAEIAETLELPPELAREWTLRGYYGTVNHNAKAVYQRYLSWYDGNPANLHPLPPVETAKRSVAYMGGADAAVARARTDFENGDFRWVAQVMGTVVFAEPAHEGARELAADAFEQLGYQAESATWRNAYLYGAQELRNGVLELPPRPLLSPDMMEAIDTGTLFDYMAARLDPAKAAGRDHVSNWRITDRGEDLALILSRSTLSHLMGRKDGDAVATVSLDHTVLANLLVGGADIAAAIDDGLVSIDGDAGTVRGMFEMLDTFPLMFDVVTG